MAIKNDAIRNLVTEAVLPADGTGEEPEAPDDEATVTPEAHGAEGEEQTEEVQSDEAPEALEGTDDEAPTEYFGVSLEGLSSEDREAVIAGYQERDKFIQQLLRNNKPEEADNQEATPDPALEEMSDEDLLKHLGLDDTDDPYAEHTAKFALPLSKLVLTLADKVEALSSRTELDSTERYWEQGLTALEAQFGSLPVSHTEVMQQAAQAGVAEPVDAYWRIMGPGRQDVMAEVQKRRADLEKTLKAGAKGTQRPAAQTPAAKKAVEAKDVREAVKIAFSNIATERGLTFGEDD